MTSPSDATSDPVPSGESPLEERLRDLAAGVELSTGVFRSSPTLGQTRATVTLSREAADELARLRSEVARLTAEREEAGRCELCGGLGYVPTRTPDESGEMYDDCRGCDGSGERPTGAQMEELRDRLEARNCDVHMACEDRRAAEARAARLQEQLDEERRMFPADGVWLVQQTPGCRRLECIHRVADLPAPIPLAAIAMRKDAIVRAVDAVRERIGGTVERLPDGSIQWMYPAASEVAEAVIDHLYRAGEGGEHAD